MTAAKITLAFLRLTDSSGCLSEKTSLVFPSDKSSVFLDDISGTGEADGFGVMQRIDYRCI